jgi:hypothetical protein
MRRRPPAAWRQESSGNKAELRRVVGMGDRIPPRPFRTTNISSGKIDEAFACMPLKKNSADLCTTKKVARTCVPSA